MDHATVQNLQKFTSLYTRSYVIAWNSRKDRIRVQYWRRYHFSSSTRHIHLRPEWHKQAAFTSHNLICVNNVILHSQPLNARFRDAAAIGYWCKHRNYHSIWSTSHGLKGQSSPITIAPQQKKYRLIFSFTTFQIIIRFSTLSANFENLNNHLVWDYNIWAIQCF